VGRIAQFATRQTVESPAPLSQVHNQMNVEAAQCPVCRDVIISRWQHDLHECHCGAIAIDGGQAYFRVLWQMPNRPIRVSVVIPSLEELRGSSGVWPAESTQPQRYELRAGKLMPA
jgi:ribosomal protein L37AE/L43A